MNLDALFTVDGGPSSFLAARQSGTPVPVVVARDALGNVLWSADVPSGDPLVADTGAPSTLGVGAGRVYVPWALRDGDTPAKIAAFEAATGRRLWDAPLTDDTGDPSAIVSDGPRAYVFVSTRRPRLGPPSRRAGQEQRVCGFEPEPPRAAPT